MQVFMFIFLGICMPFLHMLCIFFLMNMRMQRRIPLRLNLQMRMHNYALGCINTHQANLHMLVIKLK